MNFLGGSKRYLGTSGEERFLALEQQENRLACAMGKRIATHHGFSPESLAYLEKLTKGYVREGFFKALIAASKASSEILPPSNLWELTYAQRLHERRPTDLTRSYLDEQTEIVAEQFLEANEAYNQSAKEALANVAHWQGTPCNTFISAAERLFQYSYALPEDAGNGLRTRIHTDALRLLSSLPQESSHTFGLREGLLGLLTPSQLHSDSTLSGLRQQMSIVRIQYANIDFSQPALQTA